MSETLFPVAPQDDQAKKKNPGKRPTQVAVEAEPPPQPPARPTKAIRAIGRIEDTFLCEGCQAMSHDILHEDRRQWLVQCNFCLRAEWGEAIPGFIKQKPKSFQLREGVYKGLTLDEVSEESGGMEYLRFAAGRHPNLSVKKACQAWLDAFGQTS